MAISRLSTSRLTQGLPKYQSAWDQDGVQQGAMVPIASTTMNGTVTAFGFSNIPQIYQDLVLVATIRNVAGSAAAGWIINGNPAGATYGVTMLKADGASASTSRGSAMSYGASQVGALGSTSTLINAVMVVNFFDYANTARRKTWIQRTAGDLNGSGFTGMEAFTINQSTAITSIDCSTANASFFWAGTMTLYGIKAGA